MRLKRSEIVPLAVFLAGFFAVWSTWCWVLVHDPDTFGSGSVRALARLVLWIAPTFVFAAWRRRQPLLDELCLRAHAGRGIVWGLTAALVYPGAAAAYRLAVLGAAVTLPGWPEWLNAIVGAALAEELLFRGVVLPRLADRYGRVVAVLGSAVLFALIHLPYWWLAGAPAGWQLIAALATMLAYGVACALLFLATGSLWAPLLYHALNNFLVTALR